MRFISPDENIPNLYNPQSLNRFSYTLNNPYKYIDPNGNEPVRAQAGTAESVIDYLKTVEANNPQFSANIVLLKTTIAFSDYEENFEGKPSSPANFVYTSGKGVIDNRHFFVNAVLGKAGVGKHSAIGYFLDYAQEFSQRRPSASHSYFTYEDLISNREGRSFGQSLSNDRPLSEQYQAYMSEAGESDYPKSLWATMPYKENYGVLSPVWKRNYFGLGKSLPKGHATSEDSWISPSGEIYQNKKYKSILWEHNT